MHLIIMVSLLVCMGSGLFSAGVPEERTFVKTLNGAEPPIISKWNTVPHVIQSLLHYKPEVVRTEDFHAYTAEGKILSGFLVFTPKSVPLTLQLDMYDKRGLQIKGLGIHKDMRVSWLKPRVTDAHFFRNWVHARDFLQNLLDGSQDKILYMIQAPDGVGEAPEAVDAEFLRLKAILGELGGSVQFVGERDAAQIAKRRLKKKEKTVFIKKDIFIEDASVNSHITEVEEKLVLKVGDVYYCVAIMSDEAVDAYKLDSSEDEGGAAEVEFLSFAPKEPALDRILNVGRRRFITREEASQAVYVARSEMLDIGNADYILGKVGLFGHPHDHLTLEESLKAMRGGDVLQGTLWIDSDEFRDDLRGVKTSVMGESDGFTVTAIFPVDGVVDKDLVMHASLGLLVGGPRPPQTGGLRTTTPEEIKKKIKTGEIGEGVVLFQKGVQIAVGPLKNKKNENTLFTRVCFFYEGEGYSALFVTPKRQELPLGSDTHYRLLPWYEKGVTKGEATAAALRVYPVVLRDGVTVGEAAARSRVLAIPDTLHKDEAKAIMESSGLFYDSIVTHEGAIRLLTFGTFLGGIHWLDDAALTTTWKGVRRKTGLAGRHVVTTLLPADPVLGKDELLALAKAFVIAGDDIDFVAKSAGNLDQGKDLIKSPRLLPRGLILVQRGRQIPLTRLVNNNYDFARFVFYNDGGDHQPYSVVLVTPKGAYNLPQIKQK